MKGNPDGVLEPALEPPLKPVRMLEPPLEVAPIECY